MAFKYPGPLPEPARQSLLSLVAPAVLVRYVEGLRALRLRGLHIAPFETRRTAERQHWLWQQGREWDGQIVTNADSITQGWHPAGFALDSTFVDADGNPIWSVAQSLWDTFGSVMEDHGLAWGGRWKRPDSPHVQALYLPQEPTSDDAALLLRGDLMSLGHKYNLDVVSYYDVAGRL